MNKYSLSKLVLLVGAMMSLGLSATQATQPPVVSLPAVSSAERSKPNVVFIVVDDLGWRDLGCYGSTFYETPHVDALAARGCALRMRMQPTRLVRQLVRVF